MSKSANILTSIIKLVIALAILWAIYFQLFEKQDFFTLINSYRDNHNDFNYFFLFLTIVLVFVNWGIEAMKWRKIMNISVPISFSKAYLSVIRGISLGMITPASLGEYYGRTLSIPSGQAKYQSITATFYSSIAQNIMNLLIGAIGVSILYSKSHYLDGLVPSGSLLLLWLLIALVVLIYYFPGRLVSYASTMFNGKFSMFFSSLNHVSFKIKSQIIGLASARYAVYMLQYVLILDFFNIHLGIITSGLAVSIIYLIQTGLPLPSGLSFIARSSIALFVFDLFGVNAVLIILASWSLWMINLMFPALFGLILIFKLKKFL